MGLYPLLVCVFCPYPLLEGLALIPSLEMGLALPLFLMMGLALIHSCTIWLNDFVSQKYKLQRFTARLMHVIKLIVCCVSSMLFEEGLPLYCRCRRNFTSCHHYNIPPWLSLFSCVLLMSNIRGTNLNEELCHDLSF
jgi:hypothetical protein